MEEVIGAKMCLDFNFPPLELSDKKKKKKYQVDPTDVSTSLYDI